jgi:hypothetical protein
MFTAFTGGESDAGSLMALWLYCVQISSGTMNGRCGRMNPTPMKKGRLASFTQASMAAIPSEARW